MTRFLIAALLAAPLAACGASPSPPASGPAAPSSAEPTAETDGDTETPALCASPPDVLLAAQACLVAGELARVDNLVVQPAGANPFFLDVRDTNLVVAPGLSPECTAVHVLGSLEFLATSADVALRPTADDRPPDGPVTLTTQSHLTRPVAAPDGLFVDATLGSGVTLRGASVACTGLTVDDPFPWVNAWPTTQPGSSAWLPRSLPLTLLVSPEASATLSVLADHPSLLPFTIAERRDDLVRVALAWSDGASVTGWLPQADLEPATASGYGDGPSGGELRCLEPGFGCGGPGLYCGPAVLSPGAVVFAEPEIGPWAVVVDGAGAHVMRNENTGWAQIHRLPGISDAGGCDLSHAWIPAADVLPAEDAAPGTDGP